jgi:prophage maintenance system killer protein
MSLSDKILIFNDPKSGVSIQVKLDKETLWLNQYQLAELFETNRTSILKHIKNIYSTEELHEHATCAKIAQVQKEGSRSVRREVLYYNLDVIISVGYRVNSKKGTLFRKWANDVLSTYLIQGYAINQKRLNDLQQTIQLISKTSKNQNLSSDESKALIDVLSDYSLALEILDEYDHQRLSDRETTPTVSFIINYDEAKQAIEMLRKKFGASKWFGNEKDNSFKSSISSINQTFDGKELYQSIEEKAANLLYFVVKNHSFTDGNKRIAAWLFVWYLQKNGILYNKDGHKRVADNALVALTLMIAESKQEEKDIMIKLVINLINKRN